MAGQDGAQAIPQGMSRRGVLGGAAAGLTSAAGPAVARPAPGERPNILWIVSEDNNPYVGAYGDKLAHTPTIDALARKGLLFRYVYCNAPVCAPSRFGILTGVYPESCAPANHMRANARLPKEFRTYPELMRQAGYFCTNNDKADYNCDVDPQAIWDVQGKQGHWRKRPSGTPFMAVFNYMTTHESQIFKPTAGRVTPDMITVPPFLPDTPGTRQDFASYYNLMEKMDGQLAERLRELEADGLGEDTIVFHYSDNGGVLGRSKRYCYEEGHRCEMVVYVPPKWRHLMPQAPGTEVKTPVSFIDLAPTVLALAGAVQPAQMRGKPFLGPSPTPQRYAFGMRNRMDERYDFMRTVTDGRWRYIRNYMPHRPWGQHQAFEWLAKGYQEWEAAHRAGTLNAIQNRFFQTKPFEELYDLRADPHEIRNLAGEASSARMMATMRGVLDAQMVAINDNGFLAEGMAGEGYVESRNPQVYPLREVMALATIAARGEPSGLASLLAGLASPTPVMRYWAATGLLILERRATPARSALERAMRDDPVPQVRVVAAEAVAALGAVDEPVRMLGALVERSPSWPVQLQALNALTFIGAPAKAALSIVQKTAESEQEYVRNASRYLAAVLTGTYTPSTPIFDVERMMRRAAQGGGA
jgi:arylsulfatase A-like enzyme